MTNSSPGTIGGQSRARKDWVDALRALAMLLVILGHQLMGHAYFYLFTSPVKLPLFFAVTGYVFNDRGLPAGAFVKKLAYRLGLPWLIAGLGEIAVQIPFRGFGFVPDALRSAVVDVVLWYLPCLFFAELIWYFSQRSVKDTGIAAAIALVECVAGYLLAQRHILDTMMINTALIAQGFLLTGNLFRRWESRLSRPGLRLAAGCAALYFSLGLLSMAVWPKAHIDVHMNRYYCFPHALAMVLAGCTALFLVFREFRYIPKCLVYIGQNTIFYYMAHNYVITALRMVYRRVGLTLPTGLSVPVTTALACVVCGLLCVPVNRFLPELVGRKRVRKG